DRGEGGMGKVAGELPDGARGEQRCGVGEDQNVVSSLSHRVVQGAGLALAGGQKNALDIRIRSSSQDVVGAIRRAVGDDDYLEAVAWIVEPAEVRELVLEAGLLRIGPDDEGDRRQVRRILGGRAAVPSWAQGVPVPARLPGRVRREG